MSDQPNTKADQPPPPPPDVAKDESPEVVPVKLFTFFSAGWVLLLSMLASTALIVWAMAPALMNSFNRPPGDGINIESYDFDLTNCRVEQDLIAPGMLRRDMVPVMPHHETMRGADMLSFNEEQRGKFLVPSDRVIGVTINGESRAYPVSILNVHEIINDTLGGVPISVTYHWPCDSVRVFERVIDGTPVEFEVSGLLYNSNLLMYVRGEIPVGQEGHVPERLFSQLLSKSITGEAERLNVIPSALTIWQTWLERHPETSVVLKDLHFAKRYKGANPRLYFLSRDLLAPVRPLPEIEALGLKERAVLVRIGEAEMIFSLKSIQENLAGKDSLSVMIGENEVSFEAFDEVSHTVLISSSVPKNELEVIHAFWFALHGMFPDIELAP